MIYVTGSLNMDLTIASSRMPNVGETIGGHDFIANCGGKGANQAVAAAKFGSKVSMCGAVGNDSFGITLKENLEKYGVDVSHISTVDGVSSGIAVIIVNDGNNRIILDRGANYSLTKEHIDDFLSEAKRGDIYLTQLENPLGVTGYGLMRAKDKGLFTILNPAPADKAITEYLKYVDLVIPNETEAELFGGTRFFFDHGVKTVVTTLGADGYEIADGNSVVKYPCRRIKVVDTTAAGDTMCGVIAVGLSENRPLAEACRLGSLAATLACTRRGAQQSVPSRKQVDDFSLEAEPSF